MKVQGRALGVLALCAWATVAGGSAGVSEQIADEAPALQGAWAGTLTILGSELPIQVSFLIQGDTLVGTMDAQGVKGLPLADITLDGTTLRFERRASVGTLAFTGTVTGSAIEGTVAQGTFEGTFSLTKQTDDAAPVPPANEAEREGLAPVPVGDGTGRLTPCRLPGLADEVRCGTYRVWENRRTGKGRRIDLNIVVLPALEPAADRAPLVMLAGGPGGAATQMAPAVGVGFPELRRRFDVILVDQRGTGASNPLRCTYADVNEMARAVLQVDLTPEKLAACRAGLDADLTQYTTPIAMDDLAEVLRALGHDQVDVYGLSYGTRAALVLARRHPEIIRSLVLQGVTPLALKLPQNVAADAQASLDGVLEDCARDATCASAYSDLPAKVNEILRRLSGAPAGVDVTDPVTGEPATFEITADVFTGGLRSLLYASAMIQMIPRLVTAAHAGDFEPFAQAVLPLVQVFGQGLYMGTYLSVVCTEDVPFLDDAQVRAAAERTFLGDRMVRHHRAACRGWPRGTLPDGFSAPVSTDVPTLLVSGTSDPVTPPHWAEAARRHMPNSLHVVVPRAGHSDSVGPCEQGIVAAFLESGSIRGLDLSCVAAGRTRQYGPTGR